VPSGVDALDQWQEDAAVFPGDSTGIMVGCVAQW